MLKNRHCFKIAREAVIPYIKFIPYALLLGVAILFISRYICIERNRAVPNLSEDTVLSHIKNLDRMFQITYNGDITAEEIRSSIENQCKNGYYRYIWSDLFIQAETKQGQTIATICVQYIMTKEQQDYVDTKIKEIARKYIYESMDVTEKIKRISAYIQNNVSFSLEENKNNPYFLIAEGRAACLGYAMFFERMLNESGIESEIIAGTYRETAHAWNKVVVDDEPLFIDASAGDECILVTKDYLMDRGYSSYAEW